MPGERIGPGAEGIRTGVNRGGINSGAGAAESDGAAGIPQRTYVTGMALALGGILMFFTALVSAYVVRKDFPDSGWQPFEIPRILWLNTLILAASSFTLERSRRRFAANDEEGFRHWWGVTAILGVFFLAGQAIAWKQLAAAGAYLATNPGASFFYLFTAAHGLHLLGGILALLAIAFRPTQRLTRGTATQVASLYWHFMGVLWICLLLLLMTGERV